MSRGVAGRNGPIYWGPVKDKLGHMFTDVGGFLMTLIVAVIAQI